MKSFKHIMIPHFTWGNGFYENQELIYNPAPKDTDHLNAIHSDNPTNNISYLVFREVYETI